MAEAKTKANDVSVEGFLNAVEDEQKRADCFTLVKMMQKATEAKPKMWGANIVGFSSYHYVYASGQEGDWPVVAFSPRKANLTVYIMAGFEQYEPLLARLGKHSTGKSCLYIKRLSDVDQAVLSDLISESVKHMQATEVHGHTNAATAKKADARKAAAGGKKPAATKKK